MSIYDKTFLNAADQLGARLCRDSLWSNNQCNWFGPSMENVDGKWQVIHKTYGPEVYAGTSGIAMFLAHLYGATGESRYKLTAAAAMSHALSHRDELAPDTKAGVYSGQLGLVMACRALATQFNESHWHEQAKILSAELLKTGVLEAGMDVVMGSAGAVAPLLQLSDELNDTVLLELAIDHGDSLLGMSHECDEGRNWSMLPGMSALTGFAHGASGAIWALMELAEATGEKRFRVAAEQGLRWEQSHFDEAQQNWPDLRTGDVSATAPVYGLAWCHGSPGIGLSRVRAWELTGDEQYRHQAHAAIQSSSQFLHTLSPELDFDFSYCHGLTGLTELLLYASRAMDWPEPRQLVDHVVLAAIAKHTTNVATWPCGVPEGGGEAPGLMLGIAGIGYSMLRLLDDNPPPSVLLPGSERALATAAECTGIVQNNEIGKTA